MDILVNNAGLTQRSAFVDTQTAVYKKIMANQLKQELIRQP
jgi:short-subunit dehydrogenase